MHNIYSVITSNLIFYSFQCLNSTTSSTAFLLISQEIDFLTGKNILFQVLYKRVSSMVIIIPFNGKHKIMLTSLLSDYSDIVIGYFQVTLYIYEKTGHLKSYMRDKSHYGIFFFLFASTRSCFSFYKLNEKKREIVIQN